MIARTTPRPKTPSVRGEVQPHAELYHHYGFDADGIAATARNALR